MGESDNNPQESLRLTDGEWNRTFDAISDPVFVQDKDNNIVKVNKACADLLHVRPEDLIGKKCYLLMHQLDHPWPGCPYDETKLDKMPHAEEVYDSRIGLSFLITTSPILDEKGGLIGAVHIAKDITAAKKITQKLQESEEKYRTLVNNINIGIYRSTPGPEGRFLEVNPTMARIFGYDSMEELFKVNVSDLYQDSKERELFVKEVAEKVAIKNKELRLKKKDGTPIWCSLTVNTQYDESGKIKWFDGVIEDITEQKSLTDELTKKIGTLERFQRVVVDREFKMIELKKKIGELEAGLGKKNTEG